MGNKPKRKMTDAQRRAMFYRLNSGEQRRTRRAQTLDRRQTCKNVIDFGELPEPAWKRKIDYHARKPGRTDIVGVDTKGADGVMSEEEIDAIESVRRAEERTKERIRGIQESESKPYTPIPTTPEEANKLVNDAKALQKHIYEIRATKQNIHAEGDKAEKFMKSLSFHDKRFPDAKKVFLALNTASINVRDRERELIEEYNSKREAFSKYKKEVKRTEISSP